MEATYLQILSFLILFVLISTYSRSVILVDKLKLKRYSFVLLLFFSWGSIKAQLPPALENEFQQVDLLTGLKNSTTMKFAPDGRIFILDRYGEVIIYKTDSQTSVSAGSLSVFHELEDGLLGIAFDPNFLTNNFIYLTYSPANKSVNRVSRFEMNGDYLNVSSEKILLEWTTSRTAKFHSGGGMDFDSKGNLYIATGDNSGYDNLYAAWNETNPDFSAEKSSSNTNDLRGKILRITPQPDGTYTIPENNLFPIGTPLSRPEIYVMGARNPYRIFVDKNNTDWLFWGEVGPDADEQNQLGPAGLDEMNLTKSSGNYGWPYFSGVNNDAYEIPYRSPSPYYNDPSAPQNTSTWNTGATTLPEAIPAWIDFAHMSYFAGPIYYYNNNLTDQQRLPIEFDGAFFYYDFNTSRIWAVKMDAQGNVISNKRFAPGVFPGSSNTFNGFIDMSIGPDGKMYILAYGTGCCPQNVGTGRLIRVDYTGITTNAPPNVKISATPDNGSLPLVVNFSSAGTSDPNGDLSLTYEWDVDGNGIVDYTDPNPSHTYTVAGTYNVRLQVSDGNGGIGVNNITIHAGNNAASFNFISPPDGGLMNWQDDINVNLLVSDEEDGDIDCTDVNLVPSLGHLNHFHDDNTLNGCPQSIRLDDGNSHGADGDMNIFFVLNANYTDAGGLTAFDQIKLHPKRKEAEFFDTQSGTTIIPNTDPLEGGFKAIEVSNNGYISFSGRNLVNINAVKYKVAAAVGGGTIELRTGSPSGPLVATTTVLGTGSVNSWTAVETTFSDPGGKNDIFFVFKFTNPNQKFNLNYVEFLGAGASLDNSPPLVGSVAPIGNSQVKVVFSEYVTKSSAEELTNYALDNGVTITSAVLQSDGRTVLLEVSTLSSDIVYNLQIQNVKNISGMPIVTDSYSFSTISSIRINAGGPDVIHNSENFIADENFIGGTLYSNETPIAGTTDDALYKTERYGNFTYTVPVPAAGAYDIRLHFAELYFGVETGGGPGSRVFNVKIEGITVLDNFDILSETNPATALVKEFNNVSVTDGFVNIQFEGITNSAKLSALEILSPDTFNLEPKITILNPENGANVNQTFDINFSVNNWVIAEGDTHMHYSIDGELIGPHYSYDPLTIEGLSIGSHIIRLELYDATHVPTGVFDEIMVAVTDQATCNSTTFPDSWVVHQLEENPYTAVYTLPYYDVDGDGLKDIVTGGWWYKNPGSASGNWVKNTIGGGFGNVVHMYDFDGDGHVDLLGTQIGPTGNEYKSAQLLWAKNDGSGNFTVYNNIPAGTTNYSEPFLAGIAGGNFGLGSPYQMAINWNGAESTGSPVQMLTPSSDPTTGTWSLVNISGNSSGEGIKAGDIDGDGDLDLFQGINWLRNEGNGSWTSFSTGISYATTTDRVQLADFNGDGRLDGVVGQLGLGGGQGSNEFAWFEAPEDPTQPWIKHTLSDNVTGSLSVFAIDIDFDGDMDIVVGEWLGGKRLIAFENDLCNSGTWITHILDDGGLNLEHHDGAIVTDIDNDGDLDVISNGWINDKIPRIYENTSIILKTDPIANAGEDQDLILPTNSVVMNGSGSDPDGGAVSYMWSQISGPNTSTLSGDTTADLTVSNLIEGDYVFRLTVTDDEGATAFDEVTVSVLGEMAAIRINSGGPDFTFNTVDWSQDQYFSGGDSYSNPIEIANTTNDQLYQTERYSSSGTLVYDIPVPSGTYDLNLHFAEIYFGVPDSGSEGGAGSRVFNVSIENGQHQLSNYDIVVAAGGSATAVIENFKNILVEDGSLTITFTSITESPKVSGIEVFVSGSGSLSPIVDAGEDQEVYLPTNNVVLTGTGSDPDGGEVTYLWTQTSGPNTATLSGNTTAELIASDLIEGDYVFKLTVTDDEDASAFDEVTVSVLPQMPAIRINAGGPDYTYETIDWSQDQYYNGGDFYSNDIDIANTGNDQLYQTERYSSSGTLVYDIPVPSGTYDLNLHFAEIYFGVPGDGADGGAGSRIFNVSIENGQHQLSNYDIVVAAGGSATAVIENFKDIIVEDGSLTITFTSITESPKVSGIEVFVSGSGSLPPIVDAGEDKVITLPTNLVVLDGSAYDPDGGIMSSYEWTQISGPNTATFNGNTTAELTVSDLVEGDYTFRLTAIDDENDSAFDEVTVSVLAEVLAIRINSGGPEFIFRDLEWSEDQFFSEGDSSTNVIKIANTANDELYQTERYSTSGTMVYNIPVESGTYDLNLHFAEIYFGVLGAGSSGGEGSRVFNVSIEDGQKQLTNYDIVVAAGGSATAVIEHFTGIIVDDGDLTITFTGVVNFPKVSGIEVLLTGSNSLPPIVDAGGNRTISLPNNSMVLDGSAYDPDGGFISSYLWTQISGPNTAVLNNETTDNLSVSDLVEGTYIFRLTATDDDNDSAYDEMVLTVTSDVLAVRINSGGPALNFNGVQWDADQYYSGGAEYENITPIANTENDALYQTERFTTDPTGLTYEIPVENGLHNLSLHFAEIFYNVAEPASAGGVGSRVFTIDIENGTKRIENYDIVIAAGGAATAVVETFKNIAVTDGALTVTLIPVKEYPKISGLEIVQSRPPIVNAGVDQSITSPENSITLNGEGSDPDGGEVTFLWTQISGPSTATLVGADTPNLTANDLIPGTYVFNLTVTDDENDSSSDEVTIIVVPNPNNMPPAVTNPGVQNSAEDDVISLQITATDPDGDDITYSASGLPNGLSIDSATGIISGTIAAGASANSPYTVEITVTDDGTPSESATITFTWNVSATAVNGAPVVTNPGVQNSAEDDVISLQITANDPDGDNITYSASGLPIGLSIDTTSGLISGTIATGASTNSPYTVEITVTDDGTPSESATITFTWNVSATAVNGAPVVTNPGLQNSAEGNVISLQISATDPDGDDITYAASGLPNGLSIDTTTGLISGTIAAGASANSPYTIEITVTDDGTPSESTTITFTWNVSATAVNGAPVVTNPGVQNSAEDDVISLQITATDPDGDDIIYSATGLPNGLSIDTTTGLISGTIASGSSTDSPYTVEVTVMDDGTPSEYATITFTWNISATAVNGAPVVTNPGVQNSAEGDVISLQISATDPDGDGLKYSASGLPNGLSMDTTTGLISGTISTGASTNSPYTVEVTVTDDGTPSESATITFTWNVSATAVNGAPVVTNPGVQNSAEDDVISLQITATDPDGDGLKYSASGLPNGLSMDTTTGLISGTISTGASTNSPYTVEVTVTDDGTPSESATITFTWNVSATAVNGAPVVTNPGVQNSAEDDMISLQITATDPDGDGLAYSASGLPNGLSIDSATGLISGTISTGAATNSPYTVEVTVTDDGTPSESATITFTWNVSAAAVNGVPVVTHPGVQNSAEGDVVTLQITATDPDEDGLTYSASGLPNGLSIDTTTGLISGTIASGSSTNSPYTVEVTVADDGTPSESATITFTWNVSATAVNSAPVVTNPGVQNGTEGDVISLQISATDPDGDGLTYSASGLPNGLSIDTTTGLISGTISTGASTNSPYTVEVTVTDDGTPSESATITFTWNVSAAAVNGAPVVTNPGVQNSAEGDVVTLQITATDPDEDGLTYSASGLPNGLSIDTSTGIISGTISTGASTNSPYTVEVTVTDDGTPSESATITFTWNVSATAVNGAPVVTNPGVQNSAEGNVISLQISATDPDGDDITYSASGLPNGLSIDTPTGLISGTIASGSSTNSPFTVEVTVTDNGTPSESATITFTWNVSATAVNVAPVLTNPGVQNSTEGDVVTLQITATDPDGDGLTYSASGLPNGLSIDSATGIISGIISTSASTNSPYTVEVTVTDDGTPSESATITFTWNVSVAAVNGAPVVTNPGVQNGKDGDVITLQITATDPDGDDINYSASGLPGGLSINTATGLISGTIATGASANSPYATVIKVTDNGTPSESTSVTFTWNISPAAVNQAPVAVISADEILGTAPFKVNFTGSNSTDDKGIVSYFWDFKDGATSTNMNPKHVFTTPGIYKVELTVSDGTLTNTAFIIITVNEKGKKIKTLISPNPAKGTAKVYVLNATSKDVVNEINLHDAAGRFIGNIQNPQIVDGYYAVPIGNLQEGVYYLTLYMENSQVITVGMVVKN
ncbi:putative Ig domain-containing protein [uncultured Gelidibacter sp.]|uniref:putative Ig domain-containing protein n=1 Tax=uncultured Gelidibacter sp. TaxID=259318 RepID=UPI002627EF30|nr:putative Ig domain-containing protein [uncultured Gelidibacter sp.]